MGPPEAGARRGKGRGRLGHGPGRLWPWPRRPGPWGVEDPSPERDGSVTDIGPRHEDAGKATLPPVFFRRCDHVTMVLVPYGGPNTRSASRGLDSGPRRAGECDVPGIFVTDRGSRASLSGRTITEVRLRPEPVPPSRPNPHVPGVSWRPQPARAATRRPGRISDGRDGRGQRPHRPQPRPALNNPLPPHR